MGRQGGRPRKIGAPRHPSGSVVRQIWDAGKRYAASLWREDEQRAKRDPREGSVGGRLVLLTTPKGGITPIECQAGERFAEVVNRWRYTVPCSPKPNAPAANLQGGTGKSPEKDPFHLGAEEEDKITNARLGMELLRKKIVRDGMEKPPLAG